MVKTTIYNLINIKPRKNVVLWSIWKNGNITSRSSLVLSTAHLKEKNSLKIFDLTGVKSIFEDPDVYQLDSLPEQVFEDFMKYFHWVE